MFVMCWNNYIYRIFDTLRFPLVILIVFLHLKGEPSSMQIDWNNFSFIDGYNLLRTYVSCVICNIAVPLFFLMSGYLFYNRIGELTKDIYLKKIKRRLKTLCIPYFFWISLFMIGNVIFIIRSPESVSVWNSFFRYFKENGGMRIYWDCYVLGGGETPIGFVQDNSAPLLIPMWFVRDLIVVTLCSPFLWWLIRQMGLMIVLIISICYVFQYWPYIHGVSSVSFFFYSLGIYLSRHADVIDAFFGKYGLHLFISTICISFLLVYIINSNWLYAPYLMRVFMIIGSFSALFLAYKLVLTHKKIAWQKLSNASFVVYAMHMVFVSKYVRVFFRKTIVVDYSMPTLFFEYLAVPLITISVCLIFYYILRKYLPQFLLFVSGGR